MAGKENLQNVASWAKNFPERNHVQPSEHEGSMVGGYLSGESAVVVAGPPVLNSQSDAKNLIPIGLVQQAQVSQNKQLNQVFEIGGRIPFYIPARVIVTASLSRILFDGPSLFYAMYRANHTGDTLDMGSVPDVSSFGSSATKASDLPTMPYPADGQIVDAVEQKESQPGLFWTNLASSIFNKPLGLGFILYDMDGEPYGGVYLEKCYIRTHNFGISANQTVLAENVSLVATRLKPLSAKTI